MTHAVGTKAKPRQLKTPPGTPKYTMHLDTVGDRELLVCTVGKTVLWYDTAASPTCTRCSRSTATGWSSAPPTSRSRRRTGRSRRGDVRRRTPSVGWYGRKKGLRGRFGMYVPPLMEELGLAELEHNPRGNRMRAI